MLESQEQMEMSISSTLLERWNREPVYTPSWVSPLGDQSTELYDWGLITATPTQPSEDWGVINTNDETIAKEAENWGFLLPAFNYVQLGGEHYPNLDSLSKADTSLTRQTVGFTGTATFLLSEDLSIASAISYESSGITGIATFKAGINISGANWFSQAPQHTVFGEEGQFTILGTGNESITPATEIGSGSLFKFGGAVESSTKAYLQGDYSYLGGTAGQVFAPHITAVGVATLSQGREPGQTYSRIIQLPPDEFGGTISVVGFATGEKNTDSYNESSIFYGDVNEDYGNITNDPAYGFGLNVLGQASGTETYDGETDTYDQDLTFSAGGLTFDQGSGGVLILPSFDKTSQYGINFSNNVVSDNWGTLGIASVGGPKYDQFLYPNYTGFNSQEIDKGYEDHGFINEDAPSQSRFPYGSLEFKKDLDAKKVQYIPSWPGSGTITVSGIGAESNSNSLCTDTRYDKCTRAREGRGVLDIACNTLNICSSEWEDRRLTRLFVDPTLILISFVDSTLMSESNIKWSVLSVRSTTNRTESNRSTILRLGRYAEVDVVLIILIK